jgi:hypothetical protein
VHYSVLKREVDGMRQLYDSMIQRVKEARLASELQANAIRVIEPAAPVVRKNPVRTEGTQPIVEYEVADVHPAVFSLSIARLLQPF